MEIDALRTFVEVMRRGSFALVARDRLVDPSSISRTIGGLEKELGVRLFSRTTRRLAPTDAAREYFERVGPLLGELEIAALTVSDSTKNPRGTLRITATATFAQEHIVPLLPEFSRRYPDLRFDLYLTDAEVDLLDRGLDLAVRTGHLRDSDLISQRLCMLKYVVCASPDYLRRTGRPKTPRDLEHHECLREPVRGSESHWRFQREGSAPLSVAVPGRVVATNGEVLRACAKSGMGVLMVAACFVAEELANGSLVELFPEYRAAPAEFDAAVWLLYPSKAYLPLKVRLFIDFLKKKFEAGPPAEPHAPTRTGSAAAKARR